MLNRLFSRIKERGDSVIPAPLLIDSCAVTQYKKIGHGSEGKVYFGEWKKQIVAIKKFKGLDSARY